MVDSIDYYSSGLAVTAYDLFTGQGLLAGDVDFYLDCAKQFGSPVLELGAGTGRVLLPFARAGYEIVGLDSSPAMLQVAEEKLADNPEIAAQAQLVEGNMIDFDLGRQFAMVMITARSFQHLVTPVEQRAALRCTHQHLAPGGHLILDLFDPYFELLFADGEEPAAPRVIDDPRSGHQIRRAVLSRKNNPMQQTVREVLQFEAIDGGGNLIAKEETFWTLRWSVRQEIAYLLELCGFEVLKQYSDFSRSPPAYAREQLWIARAI
ncbi:MAG: class I SAM-dependent methyltransferase [Alphaproteobacteria bacterium]|nr:class I SAM-dependent methyltransferase [Alphaproteobacteria bacterium]